jgi:hypothetical protein
MMKRLFTTLLGLLLFASAVFAEDMLHLRTMGVVWSGGVPRLYFSARDLMDAEVEKKLDSGLPQRIGVQHFAYAFGREEPIAAAGHNCKVVYDLWQAVYRVEHETLGGNYTSVAVKTRAEVLERCLVMRNVPLGARLEYDGVRQIYVASLIQLNPLSTSTVARIRRWLARPRSETNVESKSFFGSFVSLFVNDQIGSAERVLRLRSQDVEIPPWR